MIRISFEITDEDSDFKEIARELEDVLSEAPHMIGRYRAELIDDCIIAGDRI